MLSAAGCRLIQSLGPETMPARNWPNIVLAASLFPSALLLAVLGWYVLVFRPSGPARWGDGVIVFYLGAITYPLSIALLSFGTFLAFRLKRKNPEKPGASLMLFAASVAFLASPWLFLLVLECVA